MFLFAFDTLYRPQMSGKTPFSTNTKRIIESYDKWQKNSISREPLIVERPMTPQFVQKAHVSIRVSYII